MITLASVCSGIGGPDLGMEQAGIVPLWMCEIDESAKSVLRRHWPTIPIYDDLTTLDGSTIPTPTIFWGSTPCQGFSIAGKRESLTDDRSNICQRFCELADQLNPPIICWENVPGVLSVKDNAFGLFLAALVGHPEALLHPDTKEYKRWWRVDKDSGARYPIWPNVGMVAGPKRTACWRVLDSQYFGVAQRRRRLFVVVDTGSGVAAKILFESEGLRRSDPPSRETGQSPTGTLTARTHGGGGLGTDFECQGGVQVAPTLLSGHNNTGGVRPPGSCPETAESLVVSGTLNSAMSRTRGAGCVDQPLVAGSVTSKWAKGTGGPSGDECQNLLAFVPIQDITHGDKQQHGCGIGSPQDPMFTLQASVQHGVVAFETKGPHTHVTELSPSLRTEEGHTGIAPVMPSMGTNQNATGRNTPKICQGLAVRRLMPIECERLQGFPDGHTGEQSDAQRYRQLGNAVTVNVGHWIGKRIVQFYTPPK